MAAAKTPKVAAVGEILEELRAGRMVVLVDDEQRENEGDLLFAAEFATPEKINFAAREARGLICLTLTREHCRRLQLAPMARQNNSAFRTNFTVSIEAAKGVSTGISAADRAHTVRTAAHADAAAADIVSPGHIFPVEAEEGGVLVRAGHTEAGCDLAKMAGFFPAAVICEIMKENGEMARLPDLLKFAARHNIKVGTIESIIEHRLRTESLVRPLLQKNMNTRWGRCQLSVFEDKVDGRLHFALTRGKISGKSAAMVRVISNASLLDAFEPAALARSWTFSETMEAFAAREKKGEGGVLLIMNADDGGAAREHLRRLQGKAETKARPPSWRQHGIGAQILRQVGVRRLRLLSSKIHLPSLAGFGLEVVEVVDHPAKKAKKKTRSRSVSKK